MYVYGGDYDTPDGTGSGTTFMSAIWQTHIFGHCRCCPILAIWKH